MLTGIKLYIPLYILLYYTSSREINSGIHYCTVGACKMYILYYIIVAYRTVLYFSDQSISRAIYNILINYVRSRTLSSDEMFVEDVTRTGRRHDDVR